MNRSLSVALALALVSVAACSTGPATHAGEPARTVGGEPANPPPGLVDARGARAVIAAGARVVDVRTPAEFAQGHVPGAVNIPFDEIGRRAAELGPPDTAILLYCRSGRRSGVAAETLRGLGYRKLYDLQRYDAWVAAASGSAGQ